MEEQQCSTQVSSVVDTSFTEECVDVVEQLLALSPLVTLLHLLLLLPQLEKELRNFSKPVLGLNIDNRSQMQQIKSNPTKHSSKKQNF